MTSLPVRAVTPSLVADQVYEVIEHAIFTGVLPSGSRLRVRDLAVMAGTSVMPVRDAIRRLEEVGLAVRTPHKGAVVRDFTILELINIYNVRTLLEVEGARLGATQISDQDVRTMRTAVKTMQTAVKHAQVSKALDADEVLLRTLYAAGGNGVLMDVIEILWKQCRPFKVIGATAAIDEGDQTLWESQPEILAAAMSHDPLRAIRATKESLLSARRRLEKRLNA